MLNLPILPLPDECVVTIDIETTGLDSARDGVTCVCVVGSDWHQVWHGEGAAGVISADDRETIGAVCRVLNNASMIYAFNGGGFDLPFLQRAWQLSETQLGMWMAKLVDPLYAVRGVLGTTQCEKLQRVLLRNGLEGKSGSGAEAVTMAREGRWEELCAYCVQDTKQTADLLCMRPTVLWNDNVCLSEAFTESYA